MAKPELGLTGFTLPFGFQRVKNVVSVKGGCIEGIDWKKAIHLWTKSAMIPIPEGSETHAEASGRSTDYGLSQELLDDALNTLNSSGGLMGSSGC
ncbi:hypothetical protein TOPH_08905 [Tolypocladium ophioglossoides CBS 100239]|uniref:Uncharacterized protein n=1 Tax=Tolypocladium ophioglossoides (strain CBS 100239) TaxID=1163406 RepID=A0A0L0MYB4_TOLOC|nr:hypothetical protein TOPH_08905 [Tolypocladium ophioglossoides CBS 100239]